MKRLQRLGTVRNVMHEEERRQAARLASDQQRLAAAEQRMQELQRYRADYARQLDARIANGINAMALRDYQAFLARLDDAIFQQSQIIARITAELEFEKLRWQEAAVRLRSVSTVIEKWETQERAQVDRSAQLETDERALRQGSRFAPEETLPGVQHDG